MKGLETDRQHPLAPAASVFVTNYSIGDTKQPGLAGIAGGHLVEATPHNREDVGRRIVGVR
jgi:hypothetical protein